VHAVRAEIDLLRGDIDAAAGRWQLIRAFPAIIGRIDSAYDAGYRAAEASLWAGRPDDALPQTRKGLALIKGPDLAILSGRLLTAGMRACADLAEQARARQDQPGAADDLADWVSQMGGAAFTAHPRVAAIPAERTTWDAERTRLAGPGNPEAWAAAATARQDLGLPTPGRIRLVAAGPGPAGCRAATRGRRRRAARRRRGRRWARAAAGADPGAGRAGPDPAPPPRQAAPAPRHPRRPHPVWADRPGAGGAAAAGGGRTNAQIGAELYISPKTAGVHVSNIVRKLGVSGAAAALAEHAGLLHPGQPGRRFRAGPRRNPCRCCSDDQFRPGCAGRAYQQFGTRVGHSFRRRSCRSYRRLSEVVPVFAVPDQDVCGGDMSLNRVQVVAT
jgi:hypothetical protein